MANRIDSKAARARLEPRREPYWFRIGPGRHIGFRRLEEGAGTWIAKSRDASTGKRPQKALGALEPVGKRDAFHVALAQASAWFGELDAGVSPNGGTVADACRNYVESLRDAKRVQTADDQEGRFRRLVYGKPIGALRLDELKPLHLRKWLAAQLPEDDDREVLRRAKESANRSRSALVAALNLARADGLVGSDFAWSTVPPFPKTRGRRSRFLDQKERGRLLEACEPDLRDLCEALLLTAARPGEIAATNVAHLDRKRESLSLSGKWDPLESTCRHASLSIL